MKKRLRQLASFVGRRSFFYLGAGFLVGIALFVVEISFAYCLQAFLGAFGLVSSAGTPAIPFLSVRSLPAILSLVFVVGSLRAALQWGQLYLAGAAEEHLKNFQRLRIVQWAFSSRSASSGEVMNLFTDLTSSASATLTYIQNLAVLAPVTLLLWLYLAHVAMLPTLVVTGLFALLGLSMQRLDHRIAEAGSQIGLHYEQMTRRTMANVKNLLLLQIYGTRERELEHIRENIWQFRAAHLTYLRLANLKYSIPQIFGILLVCIITLLMGKFAPMPASVMVSYFYLFVRFVQALADSSKNFGSIRFYWPRFVQLYQWWATAEAAIPAESRATGSASAPQPLDSLVGWKFHAVDYAYPNAPQAVFQKLGLELRPGQVTALVGASGVGKSTLIQLLLGTISPTAGSIEIYTQSGQSWPLSKIIDRVMISVGYVGAESFLVEGTVRANLTYGLHHIPTDEEIADALQRAECQFVLTLGLGHHITEQGQGLSAGQKQRLSLARALLRRPKILILDEATANLDTKTEQRLIETLLRLKGRVSIVLATHRQAMLAMADQVIPLESAPQVENLDKKNP